MASIQKRGTRWLARYRDDAGREHAQRFDRKIDAQQWLDRAAASLIAGTHVDPRTARTTVEQWCDSWIEGYGTRRASTVRMGRVHIKHITAAFGPMQLSAVRPSHVKAWTAQLKADGFADSYVYALHSRLSQILGDAVHDGILARNPCSRRTSPGTGKQRPYVATTDQVWALHDAVPEHLRTAVLLGAFVGLRVAEAAALRVVDVDFMRGIVTPAVQWPGQPLKSDASRWPVPIPGELSLELSAAVARWRGSTVLADEVGRPVGPWVIERAVRQVRGAHADPLPKGHPADCSGCLVPGLPADFRYHDLRHYFASLLIASGADVKVVQTRLRHASAVTTLNTYGHLMPDADESARAAVGAVIKARADNLRTTEASDG